MEEEVFAIEKMANKTVRRAQTGIVELLQTSSWEYGGANFWLFIMFGPLSFAFLVAFIVHLVHVSQGS